MTRTPDTSGIAVRLLAAVVALLAGAAAVVIASLLIARTLG